MNNFDANNRTKWLTFEEAKQKLGDPLSSLVLFRCKRHMVLAPRYIGKVNKGIRETLDSELRLFCPKLSAVLVAYHNVSVSQSTGDIHDEEPFLHFDIEADFLVFRPNVGCTLKGVVNKVGKDHIGCLVHSCFNASVPKPRGNTAHEGEITVGDELEFEVTAFYNNNRILSLRGLLKPGSIRKGKTTSPSVINGGEVTVESPEIQSTPLEPSRKRKREKTLGISGEGEINLSQEIITDSGSRKKKKKKIKDSSDSQNENQNSSSSFDYESNHSQKKKKKKKIKLEVEDENDNQNESFTYPSTSINHYDLKKSPKKKKKKSDKNVDQVSIESKASTPSFMDSGVDISLRESETTVSPKKKKKRKIKEEPVDNYDSSVSPSPLKKHKKKHKKKIKQEPM